MNPAATMLRCGAASPAPRCSAGSRDRAGETTASRASASGGYSSTWHGKRLAGGRFSSAHNQGGVVSMSMGKMSPKINLINVEIAGGGRAGGAEEGGEGERTKFVAETLLPTTSGNYRVRAYRHTADGVLYTEPLAIMYGEVEKGVSVPVRVHDACFTSEVLGSLKCDCADQLNLALDYIRDNGPGIVVYLQQEGRGIGLANKIAAYRMQEDGHDTVDANRVLGFPDDSREYTAVKNILAELEIESIRLMTNNPRKIDELTALGVKIDGRVPVIVKSNAVNEGYLSAKEKRMDHMLEVPLEGQYCFWDHNGDHDVAKVTQVDPELRGEGEAGGEAAPAAA